MSMPKSVTKTKVKKGKVEVTFVDSVDRVNYTIRELIQRANIDVGKYLMKECNTKARNTLRGMKRSQRVGMKTSTKGLSPAFQYWARKRENDLVIGVGKSNSTGDTWYGVEQELGTNGQPKKAIMRDTVYDNVKMIREIQSQYLSAISNEQEAIQKVANTENEE